MSCNRDKYNDEMKSKLVGVMERRPSFKKPLFPGKSVSSGKNLDGNLKTNIDIDQIMLTSNTNIYSQHSSSKKTPKAYQQPLKSMLNERSKVSDKTSLGNKSKKGIGQYRESLLENWIFKKSTSGESIERQNRQLDKIQDSQNKCKFTENLESSRNTNSNANVTRNSTAVNLRILQKQNFLKSHDKLSNIDNRNPKSSYNGENFSDNELAGLESNKKNLFSKELQKSNILNQKSKKKDSHKKHPSYVSKEEFSDYVKMKNEKDHLYQGPSIKNELKYDSKIIFNSSNNFVLSEDRFKTSRVLNTEESYSNQKARIYKTIQDMSDLNEDTTGFEIYNKNSKKDNTIDSHDNKKLRLFQSNRQNNKRQEILGPKPQTANPDKRVAGNIRASRLQDGNKSPEINSPKISQTTCNSKKAKFIYNNKVKGNRIGSNQSTGKKLTQSDERNKRSQYQTDEKDPNSAYNQLLANNQNPDDKSSKNNTLGSFIERQKHENQKIDLHNMDKLELLELKNKIDERLQLNSQQSSVSNRKYTNIEDEVNEDIENENQSNSNIFIADDILSEDLENNYNNHNIQMRIDTFSKNQNTDMTSKDNQKQDELGPDSSRKNTNKSEYKNPDHKSINSRGKNYFYTDYCDDSNSKSSMSNRQKSITADANNNNQFNRNEDISDDLAVESCKQQIYELNDKVQHVLHDLNQVRDNFNKMSNNSQDNHGSDNKINFYNFESEEPTNPRQNTLPNNITRYSNDSASKQNHFDFSKKKTPRKEKNIKVFSQTGQIFAPKSRSISKSSNQKKDYALTNYFNDKKDLIKKFRDQSKNPAVDNISKKSQKNDNRSKESSTLVNRFDYNTNHHAIIHPPQPLSKSANKKNQDNNKANYDIWKKYQKSKEHKNLGKFQTQEESDNQLSTSRQDNQTVDGDKDELIEKEDFLKYSRNAGEFQYQPFDNKFDLNDLLKINDSKQTEPTTSLKKVLQQKSKELFEKPQKQLQFNTRAYQNTSKSEREDIKSLKTKLINDLNNKRQKDSNPKARSYPQKQNYYEGPDEGNFENFEKIQNSRLPEYHSEIYMEDGYKKINEYLKDENINQNGTRLPKFFQHVSAAKNIPKMQDLNNRSEDQRHKDSRVPKRQKNVHSSLTGTDMDEYIETSQSMIYIKQKIEGFITETNQVFDLK